MKRLYDFIKWFLYITTGILFICALNMAIQGDADIPAATLWQILLSGLLTAAVTAFFHPEEEGRLPAVLNIFLHFLALCGVMLLCGRWFGWLKFDLPGIVMMVLSVAGVYLLSFLAYYIIDVRQAEQINRKLQERYGDEAH